MTINNLPKMEHRRLGFELKKFGWVGRKQRCLWLRNSNVQRKDLDQWLANFSRGDPIGNILDFAGQEDKLRKS